MSVVSSFTANISGIQVAFCEMTVNLAEAEIRWECREVNGVRLAIEDEKTVHKVEYVRKLTWALYAVTLKTHAEQLREERHHLRRPPLLAIAEEEASEYLAEVHV